MMKTKTLCLIFLLIGASGCVEFSCYSSIDYAKTHNNKLCAHANGNKQLCESLKIAEKNICELGENNNECEASGYGIETFIRVPYYHCTKFTTRETCNAKPACEWTFDDPIDMKFGDLSHTWP